MKIKILFLSLAATVAMASCTTRTHEGVELGNPNGGVKSMTIASGDLVFDVFFRDEANAVVTRGGAATENSESVTVPYSRDGASLNLTAEFSDGLAIDLTALVDRYGNLVSANLKINDEPAISNPQEEPEAPAAVEAAAPTESPPPEEPTTQQSHPETADVGQQFPGSDTVDADPAPMPRPRHVTFEYEYIDSVLQDRN